MFQVCEFLEFLKCACMYISKEWSDSSDAQTWPEQYLTANTTVNRSDIGFKNSISTVVEKIRANVMETMKNRQVN